MSQFANMELVENLKPFISRVVSDINVSVVSTYDAVANPNVVLQSNTGGSLILSSLDIFSSLNFLSNGTIGGSGNLTITSPGGITINPTSDLTLQSGGDLWIYNDIDFGHASPSISGDTITIYANSGNVQLNGDEITAVGEFVVSGGSAEITFGLTVGSLGGVDDYPTRGQIIISNSVGAAIYDVLNIRDSRFSDGVAHGMNTNDTIFQIRSPSAGTSGTAMRFYSEGPTAVWFQGDAGDVTTAWAPIILQSHFDNTTIPDANNLVAIVNANIKKAQIYGNGSYSTTGGASLGLFTLPDQGQIILRKANASYTKQIQLQDASFTHGTTQGMTNDSTYYEIGPASSSQGGGYLRGSSNSNHGLWFRGSCQVVNSGNINGDARAPLIFEGYINNGAFTSDANNLAAFRANGLAKVIFRADGMVQSMGDGRFNKGLTVGEISTKTPSKGQILIDDNGANIRSIRISSSVMNHTATDIDPSDTYFMISKYATNAGGGQILGYSTDRPGLILDGYAQNPDNTTATYSIGTVHIRAYYPSGSSMGALPAGYNLFTVRNGGSTEFIWKVGGTAYANIQWTAFDKEDDLSLVRAAAKMGTGIIQNKWDQFVSHNEDDLGELGLVVNGMTNMTGMMQLHNGALWQLHSRIAELENMSITAMIKLILNKWLRKVVR